MAEARERYRVGYALTPKKEETSILNSLVDHANKRGIDLHRIDVSKPLASQGSFHCIIHKLYGHQWNNQLRQISAQNPNTVIIDPPDRIEKLHNRITMLEAMRGLKIPNRNEKLGIPKQIVVHDKNSLSVSGDGAIGDLRFPMVAKPVEANGSATSHQMYLVFGRGGLEELTPPVVLQEFVIGRGGLEELTPPVVLQEFVNHGGVIFKVYVAGSSVTCVKRNSLADISEEKLKTMEGALSFSQVSNLAAPGYNDGDCDVEKAEMPESGFVEDVASALREALGLRLFNFDVIKDVREVNRYLVIDINYFPGYAKMPSYESVFTDFLWNVVHKKEG